LPLEAERVADHARRGRARHRRGYARPAARPVLFRLPDPEMRRRTGVCPPVDTIHGEIMATLSNKNPGATRQPTRSTVALAAVVLAGTAATAAAAPFYQLESATMLKGAAPDWDYVTLDATRPYLFIGRRGDGVTVFDVSTQKILKTLDNSQGAG